MLDFDGIFGEMRGVLALVLIALAGVVFWWARKKRWGQAGTALGFVVVGLVIFTIGMMVKDGSADGIGKNLLGIITK